MRPEIFTEFHSRDDENDLQPFRLCTCVRSVVRIATRWEIKRRVREKAIKMANDGIGTIVIHSNGCDLFYGYFLLFYSFFFLLFSSRICKVFISDSPSLFSRTILNVRCARLCVPDLLNPQTMHAIFQLFRIQWTCLHPVSSQRWECIKNFATMCVICAILFRPREKFHELIRSVQTFLRNWRNVCVCVRSWDMYVLFANTTHLRVKFVWLLLH